MSTFNAYAPLCSPARIVLTAAREQIRAPEFPDSSVNIQRLDGEGNHVALNDPRMDGMYELTVRVRDDQENWARYAMKRRGFDLAYAGGTWHESGCQRQRDTKKPPETKAESRSRVNPHGLGRGNPVNWFRDQPPQERTPSVRKQKRSDKGVTDGALTRLLKDWL